MPETRDIVFAPSGKEGPAALPGSGSASRFRQPRRNRSFPPPAPRALFYLRVLSPDLSLRFTLPPAADNPNPQRGPTPTPATPSLLSEPKEGAPGDKH